MLVEQVFCSLSDFSLFFEHDVLGWFASHDALLVCSLVDAQRLLVLRSLTMHVVLCSSSICRPRPLSFFDVGSSLKSLQSNDVQLQIVTVAHILTVCACDRKFSCLVQPIDAAAHFIPLLQASFVETTFILVVLLPCWYAAHVRCLYVVHCCALMFSFAIVCHADVAFLDSQAAGTFFMDPSIMV